MLEAHWRRSSSISGSDELLLGESSNHIASQHPLLQHKQHLQLSALVAHSVQQSPVASSIPSTPSGSFMVEYHQQGIFTQMASPSLPLGGLEASSKARHLPMDIPPAFERADFRQVLPAQHLSDFSSKYSATAMPSPMRYVSQPWGKVRPSLSVLSQS